MQFVNQTMYDKKTLTVYFRVRRKLMRNGKPLVPWIAIILMGIAEILLVHFALLAGEPGQIIRSFVFMLLLLGLIFVVLKEDALQARITLRKIDPDMRLNETEFNDDCFVASELAYHYDDVNYALETKDYFLLFISKQKGKICAKDGFTTGDPDAFRAFLEEKTGVSVEYVE